MKKLIAAAAAGTAGMLAGCGSTVSTSPATSPASTTAPPSANSTAASFTMEEGFEHDVCGIGLIMKFIPPTQSSSATTEAVVIAGPVSNVQDTVQDHTGDQALPSNAEQATAGSSITLLGKTFSVDSVDATAGKVGLTPHC